MSYNANGQSIFGALPLFIGGLAASLAAVVIGLEVGRRSARQPGK
jgi:ABC-type phosphate transport system permease subunit